MGLYVSDDSQIVVSQGGMDVLEERQRQVEQEGFSVTHDIGYEAGKLACAGLCYAGHAAQRLQGADQDRVPSPWPFEESWWKPKTVRRDLVRAAALIIAEIDRLDNLKIEADDAINH